MLDIDKDVAVRWGEISAAGERVGRAVPELVRLLAATALTFGLTFVTRNTDHVLETGVRRSIPGKQDSRNRSRREGFNRCA